MSIRYCGCVEGRRAKETEVFANGGNILIFISSIIIIMRPEDKARQHIDKLLEAAGWDVQDYENINLGASLGVAVRYFPLPPDEADYLLFINKKAVGVVEAKSKGTTLSGVSEQTNKYLVDPPETIAYVQNPLPFAYESTGVETYFRDLRDPEPRSRSIFAFHQPQTLQKWLSQEKTLRGRLKEMPPLHEEGLRSPQVEAIRNLEESFKQSRPRSLIQMASGSGKTFTAISFIYRLIKFAEAKRVLFLVDRNSLGKQTKKEFDKYVTPDDGRKFTELYNVQHLTTNTIDPVSRVCITTIQRLYSMLKGEPGIDEEAEEKSIFEISEKGGTREVSYNPEIPIEEFDFIITDECHRSIYNLWRQVLEYFDAFIVGLTATPSKQTLGFFNQNLVTEYSHERAVADGYNVGYDVYRINTEISEKGGRVEAGFYVDKRDKLTRETRWEQLDEDFEYSSKQLNRDVVVEDQIRTIVKTFRDKIFSDIFPYRNEVPKTLVFAKDDSHAEDIVRIIREEFGRGNEFCKKITYRTTGEKPENLISEFRNSFNPRIAVTVDMISTGVDIRPLECLVFMRDVKSRVFFEQMKGRGTRTVSPTDLQAVSGKNARNKTHFVIVDAVGVTESDKTDSRPLERKRSVPFDKLLNSIATGKRDEDTITSLAGRLARVNKEIPEEDKKEIEEEAGEPFEELVNGLLDAVDPDKRVEKARERFDTEEPSREQVDKIGEEIVEEACSPFDNPKLRNKIIDIKKKNEQTIDKVSKDKATVIGHDPKAKERAEKTVESFEKFIEENKDELTALQMIYEKPYSQRHVTYDQIKRLAEAIKKPPYNLTPQEVWNAYKKLEKSKVKGAGPEKLLTNIISLIKFTIGEEKLLKPFPEFVDKRFESWLEEQEKEGNEFTEEQKEWLRMIKDHIATSLSISIDDFQQVPFNQKGGAVKAYKLFGEQLDPLLKELNEALVT